MAESSGSPELPKFSDRLPDLILALRQVGRDLEQSSPNQSYLPMWEDIYASVHSLKGVLKILSCPAPLDQFIVEFNDAILLGLSGAMICRRNKEAGKSFLRLAELLDLDLDKIQINFLNEWLTNFKELYTEDETHEQRRQKIPLHLYHVTELVTKKAREVDLLNLNHCVIEDEILLDEVALWRTQLNEALTSTEFGRGLVINFLPFISPEGGRHLKVWAWVAAPTHSRAALKQRIKEIMPKAKLGKL
ncbi:MAG: hypothetical protein ACXWQO_12660 [Bdellovibrionota bacterium]